MVEETVEPTGEDRRLMDVFNLADIDDLTFEADADISEQVELVFTERITGEAHMVAASTVADALTEAAVLLNDKQAYRQLRAVGLTGSDIIDLVGRPDLAALESEWENTPEGEAWKRGYAAGTEETAAMYSEAFTRRAIAEPVLAAVGEPVEERKPSISVIPIDGAYLALIMPNTVAQG